MSRFLNLIATADNVVLAEFAVPLRWTKNDNSTLDLVGIIDLETEIYGPDGEIAFLAKTVTVKSPVINNHDFGDLLQELDRPGGTPTGVEYQLQKPISNDGGLKVIEITK